MFGPYVEYDRFQPVIMHLVTVSSFSQRIHFWFETFIPCRYCTQNKVWRKRSVGSAGLPQTFIPLDLFSLYCSDIFETPRSEISSGDDHSGETSTTVKASDEPARNEATSQSESSGASTLEIHRDTSFQESPLTSVSGIRVEEAPMPLHPEQYALKDDTVAQVLSAEITKDDETAAKRADTGTIHQQVIGHLDSTNKETPEEHDNQPKQTPQGTHASQFMYLHQQRHIASTLTSKGHISVQPSKVDAGSKSQKTCTYDVFWINFCLFDLVSNPCGTLLKSISREADRTKLIIVMQKC